MNENLKELVFKAVTSGTVFEGRIGTAYTAQDLFNMVKLTTINEMYVAAKKELTGLEGDSLYKTANTAKTKALEFKTEILKAVFEYRVEEDKKAEDAEKARKEKAEKLAILKNLKGTKELEELGKLSSEEIEKQIKEIEG